MHPLFKSKYNNNQSLSNTYTPQPLHDLERIQTIRRQLCALRCPPLQTGKCLRNTAHKMLAGNGNEIYRVVNHAVIKGAQPCPFFEPDRKERFAWWGISSIYDNVRATDLRRAQYEVMACFGSEVYYKVKQQRRTITEEEQEMVHLSFTEMGYDGSAIEFDRYEEQYSALMRLARYK